MHARTMSTLAALSLAVAGCDDAGSSTTTATGGAAATSSTTVGETTSTASANTSSSGMDSSSSTGGNPMLPTPLVVETGVTCKVVNDEALGDPTPNATHTRANLMGTDLGIPVAHDGMVWVFFGDTVGYKVIWPFGESHPDAVGHVSAASFASDPATVCSDLEILRLSPQNSIGPSVDPAIEADFAGAYMLPPQGHAIGEFIRNPSGDGSFKNLPGDFEVPSGGFSHAGSVYLFYTTVESPSDVTMKASYLAKWSAPSTSGTPTYQILYGVDERFDAQGPLGGNFINVAATTDETYVYLYGTGVYRQSAVYLARKALAQIDSAGGFEVYDAGTSTWFAAPHAAAPIIDVPGFGETSVQCNATMQRCMFLAEDSFAGNRIVARFAAQPEGPWSSAVVLHDMADPAFLAAHCCQSDTQCLGANQLFHCGKAGFYGTYLFPLMTGTPTDFTVRYTMSTWDPYNVAMLHARFVSP